MLFLTFCLVGAKNYSTIGLLVSLDCWYKFCQLLTLANNYPKSKRNIALAKNTQNIAARHFQRTRKTACTKDLRKETIITVIKKVIKF